MHQIVEFLQTWDTVLVLAVLGMAWLVFKAVAKKTETKKDDQIITGFEKLCSHLGVNPDEVAKEGINAFVKRTYPPKEDKDKPS
jgi:hypothetical protein